MHPQNPAVTQQTRLSPAQVQEIVDDPVQMQFIARAMGAVNLDALYKHVVSSPDATFAQRMQFQELVNKMGRLLPEPDKQAQGSGFSLKIVLGGGQPELELHATQVRPEAIESTAVRVEE